MEIHCRWYYFGKVCHRSGSSFTPTSVIAGPTPTFVEAGGNGFTVSALPTTGVAAGEGIPSAFATELEGGGSWLMTKDQFARYAEGQAMIGRADGQFMTSATRMNQLIQETGGDPVLLGQRMGVAWGPGTQLIRMDVTDPLLFNPRLPNASMSGANPLFTPGGLTSGGVPEIVTDRLPWQQVWSTPVAPAR